MIGLEVIDHRYAPSCVPHSAGKISSGKSEPRGSMKNNNPLNCLECEPDSESRARLEAAASELNAAADLLSASIFAHSDGALEAAYGVLRVAKTRFCAARSAHLDLCPGRGVCAIHRLGDVTAELKYLTDVQSELTSESGDSEKESDE